MKTAHIVLGPDNSTTNNVHKEETDQGVSSPNTAPCYSYAEAAKLPVLPVRCKVRIYFNIPITFINTFFIMSNVCRPPTQSYIKKNLVLAAEASVLSLETNGTHLVSLKPFVVGLLVRTGKKVYDLVAVVCKH